MPRSHELDHLMHRAARGDREALEPLFRQVWPVVHRVCRRMLGDDADDSAQTAMLKLFERAHEYDPARPALAWVVGIAAWEARSARRRLQRQAARRGVATSADAPTVSAEANLEARDLLAAVQEVLGELSALDRDTILATVTADGPVGATQRKRRQRAFRRFFQVWRLDHDDP